MNVHFFRMWLINVTNGLVQMLGFTAAYTLCFSKRNIQHKAHVGIYPGELRAYFWLAKRCVHCRGLEKCRACGSQRRIVLGVSGCCDIVRVRSLPVSGWYGREAGRRCAIGCRGRRCRGTGLSSNNNNKDLLKCG